MFKPALALLVATVTTAAFAADKPLVMTRHTIKDVERNGGQPLATLLVPKGWKSESYLKWNLGSAQFPFEAFSKFTDTEGNRTVAFLPVYQGKSSSSQFGNQGTASPGDVSEGLQTLAAAVLPGAKVKVKCENQDKKQKGKPESNGINTASHWEQTGAIVLAYRHEGKDYEQEFSGILHIQVIESQGFRSEQFFLYDVRTVRAEAGKLDEARAIASAMHRSIRPTAEFYKAIEVAQQAVRNIQNNDFQATINDGKFWKKIQVEIDANWKKVTEERWASIETRHEQFRDVLGGVNRFKNSGGEVLLPISHKYAWEGPNDTYVLSNDPSYRPDSDFNGTWNQLKAKK